MERARMTFFFFQSVTKIAIITLMIIHNVISPIYSSIQKVRITKWVQLIPPNAVIRVWTSDIESEMRFG